MALQIAKEKWNPATDGSRGNYAKRQMHGVSSKRFCCSLARAGFDPDMILKVVCQVYGLKKGQKGKPSADTLQLSTIRTWARRAKDGLNDNGEKRPDSYFELPKVLEEAANKALSAK